MIRKSAILIIIILLFLLIDISIGTATIVSEGKFYVIGTGPAGPKMATLHALETIKQMDALIASPEHFSLFADYVKNKPVLFDPWRDLYHYKGKFFRKLSRDDLAEFIQKRSQMIKHRVSEIRDHMADGKNIGLLDSGNPLLYGPSNWYSEHFEASEIVIIPGMGSDVAAMAVLGKSVLPAHDTRFVIQTSPLSLMASVGGDRQMLSDLGKYPSSMILYMALEMPGVVFGLLNQIYPPDMPCAVVFWAGYPDRQRIILGTVADMALKISQEKERYMGLLFVGRFLEGMPYTSAMRRSFFLE
jgi:precorrin-4 methylase